MSRRGHRRNIFSLNEPYDVFLDSLAFTMHVNAMVRRDGARFRGRYRTRVVASDTHWCHLLVYRMSRLADER